MTYADLQQRLALYLGLGSLADDPNVAAWGPIALNDAQRELSSIFKIPRTTEAFSTNPAFTTFPAQYDGILQASETNIGRPLAVLTSSKAISRFPNFPTASDVYPAAVVQDEINHSQLTFYPNPTSPFSVSVLYAYVAPDMVNPTDVPWGGAYAEWHDTIALRAALQIFEADWADKERIGWVKKRHDERLSQFARYVMPGANVHGPTPEEV